MRRSDPSAEGDAEPAPLADSATVPLKGPLSADAIRLVDHVAGEGDAVLIVLRDRDRRVCEDLGRQLRELLRQTARMPAVVLADSASAAAYTRYLRREHVRASLVVIAPEGLLAAQRWLPTPAVLIRHGGEVQGVAHPIRFPNLRLRSFATELQPLIH